MARDAALASRLGILTAAALFSTGGAAIKACALSGPQVASFRSAIAAVTVLLLMRSARRRWTLRAAAVGATYAATMVLFVLANKLTTAASTIFLQSTSPLYILLLGPWLLREHIRRQDALFLMALGFGMTLLFVGTDPPAASAPQPFQGNLLATASGVSWALTVMGLRWMGRTGAAGDNPAGPAVVVGNVFACAALLPWALPLGPSRPADWLVITYLGVVQIGLAYACLAHSLRHVPALEASLLLLLEPVLNPVWAWLVQGERPGAWSLAGGAVILSATVLKSLFDVRASSGDPSG